MRLIFVPLLFMLACPAFADDTPSVLVATIKLTPGSLPATVTAYGGLQPGPNAQTTITAQAAGSIVAAIYVTPGEKVVAGQTLLTLTAGPQARADRQKAAGVLAAARQNRAHVFALLSSHLATNADLATAGQAVRDAAGNFAAAEASGAGSINQAITAPFSGIVSAIPVSPGTPVTAGSFLLQLINPAGIIALAGVPPATAGQITPGDPAQISLTAGGGKTLPGQVAAVASMVNPQSGLADITILVRAGPLLLNQPIQAIITTGTLTGFVLPRDAVLNDDQGNFVFQLRNKIAHRQAVQLLASSGGQSVIAATLDPSFSVVTTGAYQLSDGMAVRTGPKN